MNMTLGKRIAALRHEKGLKQEELAQMLCVTAQAISKWENDQTCPDISLLPQLARILGVSIDELLSGKAENEPVVKMLKEDEMKDIGDLMLRIVVNGKNGDVVRVNFPLAIIEVAINSGVDMSEMSDNAALKNIDWNKIMNMVKHGVIGNLVEVESADGETVQIFVE